MLMVIASAIVNCNAIGLRLSFRTAGGYISSGGIVNWDNTGCDSYIIFYPEVFAGSAGGRADFPSGDGGPGHFIKLYSGMDSAASSNVLFSDIPHGRRHPIHRRGLRRDNHEP